MALQLWHVGAVRNRRTDWVAPGPVDSPSGLSSPGKKFGEPMSDAVIADTIAAFARAAADAKSLDELLRRLDRGDFDLVAVGRALINDPQWVPKIRDGRHDELMDFSPSSLATLF